jgi:hypothetical protein
MSTSMRRSLKRKKANKEKKAARKQLKKVMGAMDKMPDYCWKCIKNVNDNTEENKMDWYVEISNEGAVRLTCPTCRAKL